jgi:hypothetical protein
MNDFFKVEKKIYIFLLLSYISGFFLWNFYLGEYGFYELNVLQTRFIPAGTFFLVIPTIFYFVYIYFKKAILKNTSILFFLFLYIYLFSQFYSVFGETRTGINVVCGGFLVILYISWIVFKIVWIKLDFNIKEKFDKVFKVLFLILVIVIFINYSIYYRYNFFHKIPQSIGGAMPFTITILGSPEQISFLNKFNLVSLDSNNVQTVPVCEIYSDSDILMIGMRTPLEATTTLGYRMLILHKDTMKGVGVIPPRIADKARKILCPNQN